MPCSPGARLTPGSPARRRQGRSCGGRTRRRTAASTCAAARPRCRSPRVRARPTAGMPCGHAAACALHATLSSPVYHRLRWPALPSFWPEERLRHACMPGCMRPPLLGRTSAEVRPRRHSALSLQMVGIFRLRARAWVPASACTMSCQRCMHSGHPRRLPQPALLPCRVAVHTVWLLQAGMCACRGGMSSAWHALFAASL